MAQYLPLPDGSSLKLREGETPAEGWARAQQQYPEAFARAAPAEEPKGGFIPATKAGVASLKSDVAALLGRTGVIDIPTAEQYMREQEEYQRRVFKPTEKGFLEAPGTKIAELLGGSLPYMAAPVAAGAATLALPVTGAAATVAGLGAAGLTSAAQFTGSNIQRQVEEGKRLAETELGAATAAAIPQAALDMVSFRMMPGIRRIFMQAGKEIPEAAAKKIAEQNVREIIKDYTLATGKSMGTEGLTEAGQQVLERLQAGLNITDPQARSEYFDSFVGGAVLGGAISPVGRFVERGAEKRKEEREAVKAKAEEYRKQQEAKDKELAAAFGAPLLTGEEATRPLFVDEKGAPAKFTDLQERERLLAEQEQAKKDAQEQYTEITKSINDLRERAQDATPQQAVTLGREAQRLDVLKTQLENRVADKKDPLYKTKLVTFTELTQEQAEKKLTTYDALQQKIKQAQGQFEKAKEQGDVIAQGKAAEKLQNLQEELRGETPDLFGIEGQKQIAERKKTEEEAQALEERRTAFNAALLMLGKRAERAKSREELAEVTTQQDALRKLEFGLNRMGLGVLGLTGEERVKAEVDLGQGFISPTMAEKLGIYDEQFNALQDRIKKADTPQEKTAAQEQLDALKEKARDPTRAVDVLPNIEAAYEKALAQQKDTVDAVAANKFSPFDNEGQLTKQGKLAVANEAILRQLAELRRLGRESKETLESQRAEDLFAEAPTTGEVRMQRISAEAGEKPKMELEEAKVDTDFSSRNEAFEALSDSAYFLQRGSFYGDRDKGVGLAGAEEERNEKLAQKVQVLKKELAQVIRQQLDPKTQNLPSLAKRQAILEGRIKKLQAGLTTRLKDPELIVNDVIDEINKIRSETNRPPLTENEQKRVAKDIVENFQPEVMGTLGPKDRQLVPYKQEVARAERAAKYLIDDAIKDVQASRLARGMGPMPPSDETQLRNKLNTEFERFIGRVAAAERVTGEMEKKPVRVKMVDGKPVVVEELRPKKAPIEQRPYEKLGVALKTLRGELEATVTEAKGLPAKGEFVEEKVEVAKPVKEKPVKTTKKKIAERQKAAKHEERKKEAVTVGKQTIANNQKQMRELEKNLRKTGAEIARLKKAALKDKNPQMRLAKVERLEVQMEQMRSTLTELKNTNAGLAAALRTLGVETGRVRSGAYILDMIENDQYLIKEEMSEAGLGDKTIARVEQLQKIKAEQEKSLAATEATANALERRLNLLTLFPVKLKISEGSKIKTRDDLRKQVEFQKRLISQTKSEINKTQREIFSYLKRGFDEEAKEPEVTRRFTGYEVDLAAKFLQGRIDQVLARMEKAQRLVSENNNLIKAQLGTITTPTGKTLPGIRVTTEMEWSPQALNETAQQERELYQRQYNDAVAERDAIAEKLRAAGKPVRGDEAYEKAAAKARNLAKARKAVRDFVYGYVPIRTAQQIFATAPDVKEVLGRRQRQTFDFVEDKPDDAIEVAKDAHAMLVEDVLLAQEALANIPPDNKAQIKKAKAALVAAKNRLSKGSIYQLRAALTREEMQETLAEAEQNANTTKKGAIEGVLDIEAGTLSDKDIIDSIDYRDDTIDPRFGEEPTEMIDEKEAVALLDKVKEKLRKQGFGKEKPTGPDMTRRRLVQGIGAGLAVPKMPASVVKAFETAKLTEDALYKAINSAESWFESIVNTLPKNVKDYDFRVNKKSEIVYAAVEKIAGKDAARLINSFEYADPFDIYVEDFIESNNDPQILAKIKRAYDVAATDIFKYAANKLKDLETTVEPTKEVSTKAAKVKKEAEPFEYYMSVEDLPIGIRKQMAKQGMDTVASQLKGGVYKGKVFVIVQNHNDITDLQQTLAHELIGHYSFDGLLGKEGMIKLSQQIDRTPDGLAKLAEQLGGTKFKEQIEGVFIDTVRYYKKAFEDGKITDAQIRANAKIKALREMIAYTMEKDVTASRMEKLGSWYKALVGAMRAALRKLGIDLKISTSDLFYLMKQAKQNFEAGKPIAYRDVDDTISFRSAPPAPPQTGLGAMVAPRGKPFDKIKANVSGLNFRTQFVDRLAALDALIKRGVQEGIITSLKAMDVMYFNRMADQRNNFTAQFATSGVGKLVKKGNEYMYDAGQGPSLKDVSEALRDSGVPAKDVENEFTQYEIALRAQEPNVGIDKLDTRGKVTQKDVDAILAKYANNTAFKKAHALYQQYNRNLIDFVVSTGAMSAEKGAALKKMNYVPYYRQRGGFAELVVFGEQPIRIGDMKNQPYLKELVGGEEKVLPIFTGALQNTQLLVDMALKNMATRNTAFVLGEMGLLDVTEKQAAKGFTGIHKGMGPADANVIRFKIHGEDMWARVNVEAKQDIFGNIPTELVVMGMEGIKATLPVGIRLLGMPANLLRKLVTRDPRYAVRQIFRDSMSSVLTTGANFIPVVQTLKDMATMKRAGTAEVLRGRGILGGQVVVGATDDMSKILQQLSSGKPGWDMAMAKLDELAMMGDAATRVSMYNSFIKQGLSEREATFATLEAMNFSRRGLSPSILYANTLIPFFNAGVQGIDVLYRASIGDMPFNQQLDVRRKLFMRGLMMAGMTLAYAAAMDDDETYENANPDERYNNWFVPTPLGTLRVPIPFEAGLVFKGLPEGLYRMAFTDDKNSEVLGALKDLALRSVPIDMPTAIKPIVELMLNRSFFTGREIVDKSMSEIAEYQYRPNTPETIKLFGEIGISPAKVEYFIKGYTGSLPIGLIGALENVTGISTMTKEKPTMRVPDLPIVGGLFQPPDASGLINRAYETVNRVEGAKATYNRLANSDPQEAAKFLKENMQDIQLAQPSGWFRQQMGQITAYERYIRDSRTLSADDKRERLDKTKQMKIDLSKQFNKFTARIERQSVQ